MPILKDFRQTKTISLPSFPDSKVEIYNALLVGDTIGIDLKEENQMKLSVELLPHYIKSWNFTDEADKPMEIKKENLSFLKMEDLQYLADQITEFITADKKKIRRLVAIAVELNVTQKQLYEEYTEEFLTQAINYLNKKNRDANR